MLAKLDHAKSLAESLMLHWHLGEKWVFAFNESKRLAGLCVYPRLCAPGRIELSVHFVRLNDLKQIEDTILHEIAHALTPGDHHGAKWKAMCAMVGAIPRRCGYMKMPVGPWQSVCKECQVRHHRHRRPRRMHGWHCKTCGPVKGVLVWGYQNI